MGNPFVGKVGKVRQTIAVGLRSAYVHDASSICLASLTSVHQDSSPNSMNRVRELGVAALKDFHVEIFHDCNP